jgi:hypothetical protein
MKSRGSEGEGLLAEIEAVGNQCISSRYLISYGICDLEGFDIPVSYMLHFKISLHDGTRWANHVDNR